MRTIELNKKIIDYEILLNDRNPQKRLKNLESIIEKEYKNPGRKSLDYFINNHIHTTFSFSYYTPAMSILMSYLYGLKVAGIMDHDTVSGVTEFKAAGKIGGIPVTKGVECRVDFSGTRLTGKYINNPDQKSVAYVAIHGIPDSSIDRIEAFFQKYRKERNKRNILMVKRLNKILEPVSLIIDYYNDVVPVSFAECGGTITERHILFALAKKITQVFSKGAEITALLQDRMDIKIPRKNLEYLEDEKNAFYAYDLLNVLKSSLIEKFYINAGPECPDVREVLRLASDSGAICAYPYLGDVAESVTGDKRAQRFEDSYLELLCDEIKNLGFRAVTYMPARNSSTQIKRIRDLCERYGFFQISGEDINSPRQSFICEVMKDPKLYNLVDSAWALIGHEYLSEKEPDGGFLSTKTIKKYPDLYERIRAFRETGKRSIKGSI